MPVLTLTHPTLTPSPADSTEIDTNFADLLGLANGNLDNTNIAAAAGIDTSKLAARHYEFLVSLTARAEWDGAVLHVNPQATPLVEAGIPGSVTDGVAYTVLSATYTMFGAGVGGVPANTTFRVVYGYFDIGGAYNTTSTIVNNVNIPDNGAGEYLQGNLGLVTTNLPALGATPHFFGLIVSARGAAALNGPGQYLTVTLKLRRTDGLRGA